MQDYLTLPEREEEISRIGFRLGTDSYSRILSAFGLPGYSEEFASTVLELWANTEGLALRSAIEKVQAAELARAKEVLGGQAENRRERLERLADLPNDPRRISPRSRRNRR